MEVGAVVRCWTPVESQGFQMDLGVEYGKKSRVNRRLGFLT